MSDVQIEPFDISTLDREPEFFLEILLTALKDTPDGESARRVWADLQNTWLWDLGAGSYSITVDPRYQCGFSEDGDGRVLTVVTERIKDAQAVLTLGTVAVYRKTSRDIDYFDTVWDCTVTLGQDCHHAVLDYDRAGCSGRGRSSHPGTAALLAYLRAWGTVSHNPGMGES